MIADSLKLIPAELLVTLGAIIMLGLEAWGLTDRKKLAWVGAGTCLLALLMNLRCYHNASPALFGGAYMVDDAAVFLKTLMLAVTALALIIAPPCVSTQISRPGEYYTLFMFTGLGMLFLASANDLITIFLAIEMTSMPMYVLSASRKSNKRSAEAGLKFFVLGALASAFYLFGASLTMGTTGTIYVTEIAQKISSLNPAPQALIVGMLCMLGAFAFKIAAAPFHMWAPDVYEGAPVSTTAFLSTGPKIGGMAVLLRVLTTGFSATAVGLNIKGDWMLVISVLSLLSMTVGNLIAMHQTNIKRMLAFSGIAHMGYMLVGVAAASVKGTAAVLFYLWLYTLGSLGAWAVIITCCAATESEEIKDLAGLSRRSPALALTLLLAFLSLAGLPPLSGFVGKFYLFTAAWHTGLSWLVLAGIVNSVASLFYYMGVLKAVYWLEPTSDAPIAISAGVRVAMLVGLIAAVVLGLLPGLSSWATLVASTFHPSL